MSRTTLASCSQFTADTLLVDFALYQYNHSGTRTPQGMFMHSIECPAGDHWAVDLGGPSYLGNPATQASVNYVVDAKFTVQGLPDSIWPWAAGTPASRPFLHTEQAGYAAYTTAMWKGQESPGTTFVDPHNNTITWTGQDNLYMAAQMDNLARLWADRIVHYGWTYEWATETELRDICNGANLGKHAYHAMASAVVGGSVHHDPIHSYPDDISYPFDYFMAKVKAFGQGTGQPTTPTGDTSMALTPDVQTAFDKIPAQVWGAKNVAISSNGKRVVIPASQALELSVNLIGHTRDAIAALSALTTALKANTVNYVFFQNGNAVYEAFLPTGTVVGIHNPAELAARQNLLTKTGNKYMSWPGGAVPPVVAQAFGVK